MTSNRAASIPRRSVQNHRSFRTGSNVLQVVISLLRPASIFCIGQRVVYRAEPLVPPSFFTNPLCDVIKPQSQPHAYQPMNVLVNQRIVDCWGELEREFEQILAIRCLCTKAA